MSPIEMPSPQIEVSRHAAAAFLTENLFPEEMATHRSGEPETAERKKLDPATAGSGTTDEPAADRNDPAVNGEDSGAGAVGRMVARLGLIQMDPVRIVERSHELSLYNRIDGYRPEHLGRAVETHRVFEYLCGIRALLPMAEYPYFAPRMTERAERYAAKLKELEQAMATVISAIEREGPLPARRIEDGTKISGWWDSSESLATKTTTHALHLLWECGRVTACGRVNGEIVYDLTERAIPEPLLEEARRMSEPEAAEHLVRKYYRAYRLFDEGHIFFGYSQYRIAERREIIRRDVSRGILVPVKVAGVKRRYYCLSEDAETLVSAGNRTDERPRLHILSPLDNFLWRRERLQDLFGFLYTWEIYTPARKRAFGPYTMPVLYGTTIPARIDLSHRRSEGVLSVEKLYWEPDLAEPVKKKVSGTLESELFRLARFLGAAEVRFASQD